MVGGVPETSTWQNRHGGYVRALESRGIAVRDEWTVTGTVTRDFSIRATQKILAVRPRVTAVFAYNDYAAMWIYAGLRQAGREVGKDMAVVGFDNLADSEACLPALTTVESYPRTLGAAAGEMLLRRLGKPAGPREKLELSARLIVRASSPAPR
jgi:LacI family transcriptional regulator